MTLRTFCDPRFATRSAFIIRREHSTRKRGETVLVESSFDESWTRWATMVFLKALVEVKILEHLRERDLESTSNVPFGGGRCKWGCWLFGGGCWMIVDICQDGCFWGVGFDAIRDLSIFASWLYSAVSNLWVGVTFLLTIPMVTRLTRWRFFWCQGNLCLLGWSFLQRIAQKCGSC